MTSALDPNVLVRLARIHTGSLSDALGSIGALGTAVRPIVPGARVVGPAFTVKCYPGSIITVHKALMEAPAGVVLVVDDEGDTRGALWGEVMTHQAMRQGLLGLVTDGPVRDTAEIVALGFPVFAASVTPRVGTNRRVGFTQIPIACAGVPVHPGDIVVADADGVVIIPREQVLAVAERAEGIVRRDESFVRQIGEGKHLVDLLQFRELITGGR
jgi:4-hydroxy-4-methyl-2-oxoglutarate aldolase